jgi:hypothetical protein
MSRLDAARSGARYLERRVVLDEPELRRGVAIVPPCWTDIGADVVLDVCREYALEGVVCKRADSTYRPGRSRSWVKTVIRHKTAAVVIGWVPARSDAVGALLLGAHDRAGDLVYCGSVTSGLSQQAKRQLHELLRGLETRTAAVADLGAPSTPSRVRWCAPQLVGIVEYRGFTGRRFRLPSWKGLVRADAGHIPGAGGAVVSDEAQDDPDTLGRTVRDLAGAHRLRRPAGAGPPRRNRDSGTRCGAAPGGGTTSARAGGDTGRIICNGLRGV